MPTHARKKKAPVAFAHHQTCCRVDSTIASRRNESVSLGDSYNEEAANPDGCIDADQQRGGLPLLQLALAWSSLESVPTSGHL
jgi:hypothetical protein